MKWRNIKTCKDKKKHYSRGKLYCIDFQITQLFEDKKFIGWNVIIKNTKTKEVFNTHQHFDLIFKIFEEAQLWCENYAVFSYYIIYNKYENYISIEEKIKGKNKKHKRFYSNENKNNNKIFKTFMQKELINIEFRVKENNLLNKEEINKLLDQYK